MGREVTLEWLLLVFEETCYALKVKPGHLDLTIADIDDKVWHQLAVKAGKVALIFRGSVSNLQHSVDILSTVHCLFCSF